MGALYVPFVMPLWDKRDYTLPSLRAGMKSKGTYVPPHRVPLILMPKQMPQAGGCAGCHTKL